MNTVRDIFDSPELYPLGMDFDKRMLMFIRMSRADYRDYLFLGFGAAKRHGKGIYHVKLEDVLHAAKTAPVQGNPGHFVLHTAYCCSTLLARYFELVPSFFVLKEPQLLTQFALMANRSFPRWDEGFRLCLRLLTRTYESGEAAIIKANVPCNLLGQRLLNLDDSSTITFVMTPLKQFMLGALKTQLRRNRVRYWARNMVDMKRIFPQSGHDSEFTDLTDSQAAVCVWLFNRYLCQQLESGPNRSRVFVVDGGQLAEKPDQFLPPILGRCGFSIDNSELTRLVDHPSVRLHAKTLSKPYDAAMRRQEITKLETLFGQEAQTAIEWATARSSNSDLPFDRWAA